MIIYDYLTSEGSTDDVSDNDYLAQSFTTNADVRLTSIDFIMYRSGGVLGDITIEIQSEVASLPDNIAIGIGKVNADNITLSNGGEIVRVPITADITKDTTYYIVIKCPDQAVNTLEVSVLFKDFDRNGLLYKSLDGGTVWALQLNSSIAYRLHGIYKGSKGTKEIATRYPVTSGLTAETTKQTGRITNLVPQESNVASSEKVGL